MAEYFKIKNILLSVLVYLVINTATSGQSLPKQCKVWLPEYIANTTKPQSNWTKDQKWEDWAVAKIKNNDLGNANTLVWRVWSDRSNNKTYTEPSIFSDIHSTLDFMEKLNVAEIQNGFVLVYKSDYAGIEIPKDARCFGWISVENLLLWEECPMNHSKIYQKALFVHDPMKQWSIAEKKPSFYLEPDIKADVNPYRSANDLEIYFVMKTSGVGHSKYYLLSQSHLIGSSKQTVYGWVPEEYVIELNGRLFIEPSYSQRTVDYYKSKNIYPAIFSEMDDAQQLWTNEVLQKPLWLYYDFSDQRMHPYTMRFPVLSNGEIAADIYCVASISSILSQEIDPALLKTIESLNQAKDNINVIFVIEATSSMRNYYQSVTNVLATTMKDNFIYDIKTGVVLYKNSNDPDNIIYKKLTNRIDEVSSFVALNQETIWTSDTNEYTKMFLGLETALDTRQMGFDNTHTNFIILIGNAGNLRTDPNGVKWQDNVEKLAQEMCDKRINFLAYQVHNAGSTAYDDFAVQIGKMQKELAKKYQDIIHTDVLEYEMQTNRMYVLKRKGSNDELPVYISYKYASPGQSETMEGLQNLINGNISDFQDFVFNQHSQLNAFVNYRQTAYLVEQKLTEILRLHDWNETDINKYISYLKDVGISKFIGYAPIKTSKTEYQLFDYVLFFSQGELEELIQQLSIINWSDVISEPKVLQEVIFNLGQAMLSQFNDDEIRNMDLDQLLGQIYGIPVPLNLCGLDIKRIPDMDKEDLADYITFFRAKLEKLKRINSDSDYEGRFQRNRVTYYWIPLDEMPGVYEDCNKLKIN